MGWDPKKEFQFIPGKSESKIALHDDVHPNQNSGRAIVGCVPAKNVKFYNRHTAKRFPIQGHVRRMKVGVCQTAAGLNNTFIVWFETKLGDQFTVESRIGSCGVPDCKSVDLVWRRPLRVVRM
ncbi:MAG: hypothetical protein OXU26_02910 [Acidobacteriota bacterium]|nr:hypothetical protein [Acidobacteriota bacterium]